MFSFQALKYLHELQKLGRFHTDNCVVGKTATQMQTKVFVCFRGSDVCQPNRPHMEAVHLYKMFLGSF